MEQRWRRDDEQWSQYRIALARQGGELVRSQQFGTVVVPVGMPGSGKSMEVCASAVGLWRGSVLFVGPRYDVVGATRDRRSTTGRVAVFDPLALRPGGDAFDIFDGCARSFDRCVELAGDLTRGMVFAASGRGETEFWTTKATQALAPMIYAVTAGGISRESPIETLVRWAATQERSEPMSLLSALGAGHAADMLEGLGIGYDDRTTQSIFLTLTACLAPYDRASVRSAVASDGLSMTGFLDGPNTLYAVAPVVDQHAAAPVMGLVISQVMRAAQRQAERTNIPARLLVVIDEAGNAASVPQLSTYITTAAGTGIAMLTTFHDPDQLEMTYGSYGARSILSNASELLFLAGTSPSAAALLDAHAGPIIAGLDDGSGIARLRKIKKGTGVLVRPEHEPAAMDLLGYWRDRQVAAVLDL